MAKKQDVKQALDLLRAQMADADAADGVRQGAAKAILSYYRESINPAAKKGQSKAKAKKEDAAVAAAERVRRVK